MDEDGIVMTMILVAVSVIIGIFLGGMIWNNSNKVPQLIENTYLIYDNSIYKKLDIENIEELLEE